MVKLTGPMLSRAASGTLAGQLTFGFSGTTPTLRKKPTPKQPRSGLQISMRAMMTFLSKQWKNLTTNQQETWNLCGTHKRLDAYHRYLGHNLERWRNKRPPTKEYPAAAAMDLLHSFEPIATGHIRHIDLAIDRNGEGDNAWAFLIFHSDIALPDPDLEKLVHVLPAETPGFFYWTHSHLQPAEHHYTVVPFTDDGKHDWDNWNADSAIVT